jgi:hypothetical protein
LNSTYEVAPKQVTAKLHHIFDLTTALQLLQSFHCDQQDTDRTKQALLLCTYSFIAKNIQTLSTITLTTTTTYAFNKKMCRVQQLFVAAVVLMKSWTMVRALSDGSGLKVSASTEGLNRRLRGIKTAPIRVKSRRLMAPMSKLRNARHCFNSVQSEKLVQ